MGNGPTLSEIQTFEHEVLIIGAGGAGLRAAIEASSMGKNTGIVCKSLLGKAHTVMAEGGCAAAPAGGSSAFGLLLLGLVAVRRSRRTR